MARLDPLTAGPQAVLIALAAVGGVWFGGVRLGGAQRETAVGQDVSQPRYLPAVRQELERLELAPDCQSEGRARARCVVRLDADRELRVVVSEETQTVYVALPDLGVIAPDGPDTDARLRRLAELDWDLLGSKLEWDPHSGAVRLSAVLRTDSNFDRQAFRVVVRALTAHARRLKPMLR